MTTIQKALLATTVAAALGIGIYQARQASLLRDEAQTLRQQRTSLAEQLRQLQRERDDATTRLAAMEGENERLKSGEAATELRKLRGEVARRRNAASDPKASSINSALAKVNLLKQRLEQTPGAKIPEFRFLTEEDWLSAAKGNLNTEDDYRRAFAALRNAAEQVFAPLLQKALGQYLRANQGQFPTDLSQLQPFFKSPVEDDLLQRWQIAPAGNYPNMGDYGSPSVLTQKAAVDEDYDLCAVLGPQGDGWCNFKVENAFQAVLPVFQAYLAVHSQTDLNNNGQIDLSRLKPYVQTPGQQAALGVLLQAQNGPRNW
jgi:hypothetical protein